MIEIVSTKGKFTDGSDAIVRAFCDVTKETTGEVIELWVARNGGPETRILGIPRRELALGLVALVKVGDVNNEQS